jgi:hypothetical protein
MGGIVGAYHIAIMNNWREVVAEQTARMIESGLLERTNQVLIGVVGGKLNQGDLRRDLARKSTIVCSPNLKDYEFLTLRVLQNHSINHNFKAWYVHTKGVSREPNQLVTNWRRLMEYFIIDRFNVCITELDSCDACGVNIITKYHPGRFFAGNFWWSNSRHLSKLPQIGSLELSCRFLAEHWIGWNSAQMKDLYDGDRDSYCIESLRRSHPTYTLRNGIFWDGKRLTGHPKIAAEEE